MDESLQEMEAELKALKLQRPAARLLDRIERELAEPRPASPISGQPRYKTSTNLSSWKWLGWTTAGLATACALVATIGIVRSKQPAPVDHASTITLANASPGKATPAVPAPQNRYQPVAATNVLYDLKDEGPVYVDGDQPARRLRYRYLDTYTWKSSKGNASLKWSVPRDEIRVLPTSMN